MAFKRSLFFHVNKYQRSILLYLIALGVSCLVLILMFLSYLYVDINNFLHSFPFRTLKICIIVAFPIVSIMLLLVCLHLYRLTSRIFGPYDRVVKEMDVLLQTGQKKEITARKGDEMFKELLKRINALIGRLS